MQIIVYYSVVYGRFFFFLFERRTHTLRRNLQTLTPPCTRFYLFFIYKIRSIIGSDREKKATEKSKLFQSFKNTIRKVGFGVNVNVKLKERKKRKLNTVVFVDLDVCLKLSFY